MAAFVAVSRPFRQAVLHPGWRCGPNLPASPPPPLHAPTQPPPVRRVGASPSHCPHVPSRGPVRSSCSPAGNPLCTLLLSARSPPPPPLLTTYSGDIPSMHARTRARPQPLPPSGPRHISLASLHLPTRTSHQTVPHASPRLFAPLHTTYQRSHTPSLASLHHSKFELPAQYDTHTPSHPPLLRAPPPTALLSAYCLGVPPVPGTTLLCMRLPAPAF